MNQSRSILVTGCNGFIGHGVAARAITRGLEVTGLSLHLPAEANRIDGADYIEADMGDLEALNHAIDGQKFDYIVNCGGYIDHAGYFDGGQHLIQSHFTGLTNLVTCIQHPGLRGFVQIGSSDEYGDAPSPQNESVRECPISAYSCAKVAASHFLQTLHRTEGFPGTVARLFLVYGPGQNMQRFIPQIIMGCLQNKDFPVSEGKQIRDFCFIDDISEGILQLLDASNTYGEVVNLASGKGVSIREVIEKIQNRIQNGNPDYGQVSYRTGENMSLYADIGKITRLTNWRPTVNIDRGLDKTISWFEGRLGSD